MVIEFFVSTNKEKWYFEESLNIIEKTEVDDSALQEWKKIPGWEKWHVINEIPKNQQPKSYFNKPTFLEKSCGSLLETLLNINFEKLFENELYPIIKVCSEKMETGTNIKKLLHEYKKKEESIYFTKYPVLIGFNIDLFDINAENPEKLLQSYKKSKNIFMDQMERIYNYINLCSTAEFYRSYEEFSILVQSHYFEGCPNPEICAYKDFKEGVIPLNSFKDIKNFNGKYYAGKIKHRYKTSSIFEMCKISLRELFKKKKTVSKCKNCNKYFIPLKKTDTIYCYNISPSNPTKICKEIGAQKTYSNKDDENKKLWLTIYGRLHNRYAREVDRKEKGLKYKGKKPFFETTKTDEEIYNYCVEQNKTMKLQPKTNYNNWLKQIEKETK